MSTTVLFLILGLGSGAVYASLALGLVVTYRSSGVVNLASGADGAAGRPDTRSQPHR
jgi:branched-subunit amino acid ABC-type transport system permease component